MRRDFDPCDPFCRIVQAVKELKSLHDFYEQAFEVGGFGPWEQLDDNLLYFTPAWCRLFGLKEAPSSLEGYLRLIDDETDRQRVRTGRQNLTLMVHGTQWSDTFRMAGRTVSSACFTMKSGRLVGVDFLNARQSTDSVAQEIKKP